MCLPFDGASSDPRRKVLNQIRRYETNSATSRLGVLETGEAAGRAERKGQRTAAFDGQSRPKEPLSGGANTGGTDPIFSWFAGRPILRTSHFLHTWDPRNGVHARESRTRSAIKPTQCYHKTPAGFRNYE